LAIWLRSTQSVEHDVKIADKGKHEGVVKPETVSNYSLNYREDRPAYDGHIQDAGPASTQRTELCFSQTKDGREHDRVEEPDGKDAPHRCMAAQEHRSSDQCPGNNRTESKQIIGA
jgi:hypothetical protein